MNAGLFLLVILGGGVGASARFGLDGFVMRRLGGTYPWGTFVINTSGSLLLGLLTGMAASHTLDGHWLAIAGAGFMGGYTTFSTAMIDTVHLLQKRKVGRAIWHGLGMMVITIALALVGLHVGRSL